MISPCPYLGPQGFFVFLLPVQLGNDRAALVGIWHSAKVNPPEFGIKVYLNCCWFREEIFFV